MIGKKFTYWTVIGDAPSFRFCNGRSIAKAYKCKCRCGKIKVVSACSLRNKSSRSCGCYCATVNKRLHGRHLQTKTKLYRRWYSMISRCRYTTFSTTKYYGAKGIKVCKRWHKFENFVEDMGQPPFPGASIERINSKKGYCPTNCKWASHKEQNRNMSSNKFYTYNGKTMCIPDWAALYGVTKEMIKARMRKGQDFVTALTTPKQRNR